MQIHLDTIAEHKVSVIMPVYNTEEKYIKKSVESVINQLYSNFELIIVDDGSRDDVANVCDRFAEKDKRVHVIHKRNEGVSAARNDALALVNGAYFTFLDSDDMWEKNFLMDMVSAIDANGLDMVMCDYSTISEDDKTLKITKKKNNLEFLKQEIAIQKLLFMQYTCDASAIFATIYRTSVLGHYRFDTDVALAEDVLYKFDCMKASTKIAYLHKALMSYRIRLTGAMKSRFKPNYLNTLNQLEILAEKNLKYREGLLCRLVRICFVLSKMDGIRENQLAQIKLLIKKYRWSVLINKKCGLKMYGAIILNYLGVL